MTTEPKTEAPPLLSPAFTVNPYPTFAHMRETSPVIHFSHPGGLELYFVTRYQEGKQVLADPRFSKKLANAAKGSLFRRELAPRLDQLNHHVFASDPPDHTRMRRVIGREFSPHIVETMRGRVADHVEELLDAISARGTADLVADFADPLPVDTISELLGVRPDEWEVFRDATKDVIYAQATAGLESIDAAKYRMVDVLEALIEQKRATPDGRMISNLVKACDEEVLSASELVGSLFLLLITGHETTTNLIGNGLLALIENPDQAELLRSRPELIGNAVEEFLRFNVPLHAAGARFPLEDVVIGGVAIPKGASVLVLLGAANHDPEVFPDPDRLDITRDAGAHLSFSHGIHACPGRQLAKMEGEIAIQTALRRLPDLRVAQTPQWWPGLQFHGMRTFPVTFTPGH